MMKTIISTVCLLAFLATGCSVAPIHPLVVTEAGPVAFVPGQNGAATTTFVSTVLAVPAQRGQPYDAFYRIGGQATPYTVCTLDSFMYYHASGNLGTVRMLGQGLGHPSWDTRGRLVMTPVSGWHCRDLRAEIFSNGRDDSRGFLHIAPGDLKCFTEYSDVAGWSRQDRGGHNDDDPLHMALHMVGVPAKASRGTFADMLRLHDAGLNLGFTLQARPEWGRGQYELVPAAQTRPGFQC
jgi:hypothetical protein